MLEHPGSSFILLIDWLNARITIVGALCVTLALMSFLLGFAHSILLYVAAAFMFLIAQLFIIRWMFGKGMRSIKDLGFSSNMQALKYGLFFKGVDWRLVVVAAYGLIASIILAFFGMGQIVSGAMLLSFATFGAATQAIRLNRFWPSDANS